MTTEESLYVLKVADSDSPLNEPMTLSQTVKFIEDSKETGNPFSENLLETKANCEGLKIWEYGAGELSDDELEHLWLYYCNRDVTIIIDREQVARVGKNARLLLMWNDEDGAEPGEWTEPRYVAYPQPLPLTESNVADFAEHALEAELVKVED